MTDFILITKDTCMFTKYNKNYVAQVLIIDNNVGIKFIGSLPYDTFFATGSYEGR